jgi:cytochrome bd-type quinol oxidase subunit 2
MTLLLSEFPTFGRVATWDEWRIATAQALPHVLFQWFVSNMVGFLLLWIAVKFPWFSRKAWGLLMIMASFFNAYMAITNPTRYIEFGLLAIPPMQRFIYSKFFASPALLVLPIAVIQLLIGIILLLSETPSTLKAGLVGAIFWFLGLTTLALGSAFPSSLIYATTMLLCWPSSTSTQHKQKIS